ncbi:MAG TPA: 30S ribosomal protein S20 [Acidimicrobiales bacterium]|nr:30S ribosomal protein S20 [Acidimicrobiales bacterium]
MANIKSQIKRNRQNLVRHERNKAVRSELKTRVKAAVVAAEDGDEDAEAKLRLAVKRIDSAAAKGVIHKNQAARRKARLRARVSQASGTTSEATEADEATEA